MYDQAGPVLRIECGSNDVSPYRHHRKVEKTSFSQGDLAGLMRAGGARDLEFIGELEARSGGQTNSAREPQ